MRFQVVGQLGDVGYGESGSWLGVLIRFEGHDESEVHHVSLTTDLNHLGPDVPEHVVEGLVPGPDMDWPVVFTALGEPVSDRHRPPTQVWSLSDQSQRDLVVRYSGDPDMGDDWYRVGEWNWSRALANEFEGVWFEADLVWEVPQV